MFSFQLSGIGPSKLCLRLTLIMSMVLQPATSFAAGITLDELISQALASYPTILARQSSREAAKTDLTAAKLKFLPNPSVSTQRNQVAYTNNNLTNLPATNVTISQPIFMGGGLVAGYNKADARLSAADFAVLETREDISRRIIIAYTEWYKAHLKILAFEESVKLHQKLVDLITRRYEAGVASGSDKDLGISRLMQAKADLDSQRSIEESSLTTISQLSGQLITRPDLIERIAKPVSIPKRQDGIFQALAVSVTIQRLKYEAEVAEHEAKEIRAQALPQVSFQAQRQIGNTYVPGYPGYDMYGLVVSYTPGGGFSSVPATSAAFERAKSSMMQVEVSKRDLSDRLNAEYNEYEFSQLKKESFQRSADLSSDISASYDRQYLVGKKSWLDLMNAVRERAQTRVSLADADGGLLGSSYRLAIYINGTKQFGEVNR
jgi:adhesin transport system outer membrane protein